MNNSFAYKAKAPTQGVYPPGNVHSTPSISDRPGRLPKDTNILVVGAGPAGLSAARELAAQGYTNITIWEANPKVGGKVQSFKCDGKVYDMGAAGGVRGDYAALLERSQHFNLPMFDFANNRRFELDGGAEVSESFFHHLACAKDAVAYLWNLSMWDMPASGPTNDIPPDLSKSWRQLVEEKGWQALDKELAGYIRGAGYKDDGELIDDHTPAYYVAQYVRSIALQNLALGRLVGWENGIQELWEKEAEELEAQGVTVLTLHPLTSIARHDDYVEAWSTHSKKPVRFDKVLFACEPELLISGEKPILADATSEEQATFSKLHTVDYRTCLAKVTGLPDEMVTHTFASVKELIDGKSGHLTMWSKKHDHYVFFVYGSGRSEEEIWETLREDVKRMGGEITEEVKQMSWDYFPHVNPEDMDFFKRVEHMQGDHNTFYCGASLSFETMRAAADNGIDIAKRMTYLPFPRH
jgi:hypothetical protein